MQYLIKQEQPPNFRSALQRHLTDLKRPFDSRATTFKRSNGVLDAVLKRNKASGYCKPVKHKDVLTAANKDRLTNYFADVLETQDTYKVQSFVWYNIAKHFGSRGAEVFAKLKKTDLKLRTGADDK